MVQTASRLGLGADLAHVLEYTEEVWRDLGDARLFVTGGTGFFGRWLLASLLAAREQFGARVTATLLTRNPGGFAAGSPELAADPAIRLLRGDVRDFDFPAGSFTHVIHAATPADAAFNRDHPREMFETIVQGTSRVLDFAADSGARTVLLCSSGAVYGPQPPEPERLSEEYTGGPDPLNPAFAYAEGKRAAELLCVSAAQAYGIEVKIARGFTFAGPFLPLDIHFAVGNFLRDALAGRTIRITGDGSPYRSYLYAADLAIWLWTILARGESCRAYNVGSEDAVSIAELAEVVRAVVAPEIAVEIDLPRKPGPAARYVPSTARARTELGLAQRITLEDAIRRTASWHRR